MSWSTVRIQCSREVNHSLVCDPLFAQCIFSLITSLSATLTECLLFLYPNCIILLHVFCYPQSLII